MKISRKGEYALKALVELALEYGRGNSSIQINDVARRKGIRQK